MQELQRSGAGVMCAIAISDPAQYLPYQLSSNWRMDQAEGSAADVGAEPRTAALHAAAAMQPAGSTAEKQAKLNWKKVLPSRELEFDVQGSIEVVGDQALIDIGEIKTRLDYGQAVPQLGQRLVVLRWLLHVCRGIPLDKVMMLGRLFVLHRGSGAADAQQCKKALEYGYKLIVE